MIRIRFHGRGGHGVKTASRILGAAAFRRGLPVQDCPVYGAERRGAAVAAFTRIDREAILERGVIDRPDLIVVGDETLLEDAAAGVLAGHESAAAMFVSATDAAAVKRRFDLRLPVQALDVTTKSLEVLGRASALSAALAGAAARMTGVVTAEDLRQAVREELADLGLEAGVIERNESVAAWAFDALEEVDFASSSRAAEPEEAGDVCRVEYDDLPRGGPVILAPGNAAERATGSWRVERPEIDRDACVRCDLCFVLCPDGAIALDESGYPVIDYDHCKGCMVCLEECPAGAVSARREVRSW